MIFAGGVGDWRKLSNINDPLPEAMRAVVGQKSGWLHMLVWLGLFGLVASFHGIIMGYSRQIFALGREGFLPKFLAKIHPTFKTPYIAIIAGGIFGIGIIFSDNLIIIGGQSLSANIVTMSVFGAIVMYITSILSLFKLRVKEPNLERPFLTPFYPVFPIIALVLSIFCLFSLIYCYLLYF
jgi:ethanolamine permease